MLQTLRERFVDFHQFIASGFRQRTNRTSKRMSGQMRNQRRYYLFSVTVMVHHTCGTARVQSYTTPTSTRHAGRMLTVHVQPPSPLLPFQVTSYYSPVADASEDQRDCLEALRARLTASARTGCLHIVGGDFNVSLFSAERYGYTDPRYQRTLEEADNRFSDFIHHPELLHKWWTAGIRSGLLSWRGVRTWHHGNSRLDHVNHATILADIPDKFLPSPRPTGTHSRQVIDHRQWTAQADEWCVRALAQSQHTQQHDDSLAEVIRWSHIAVSTAPKKETRSSYTRRPPADSAEQRQLHRQIRLLEREILYYQNNTD
jgi:hypothetical protein